MDLWRLECKKCKYSTHVLTGTPEPGQTYSDLNEDFSFYQLYECENDKALLSINIRDSDFSGKCPEHDTVLRKFENLPTGCPKCGARLEATKLELHPLEESERS